MVSKTGCQQPRTQSLNALLGRVYGLDAGRLGTLGSALAEKALDIAENLCALPVVEFQYPAH